MLSMSMCGASMSMRGAPGADLPCPVVSGVRRCEAASTINPETSGSCACRCYRRDPDTGEEKPELGCA